MTSSSFAVISAIFLLYTLAILVILQFAKAAKLKPNPPESATMRVEFTISAPTPAGDYPGKSSKPSITTTFVFADEFASMVADFLAGYSSPSRSDLLSYFEQQGGTIAGLLITHRDNNHIRSLTLLGEDAEKVSAYLKHCFNSQLSSAPDESRYEPVSLTA